jgi:hypothetical protein
LDDILNIAQTEENINLPDIRIDENEEKKEDNKEEKNDDVIQKSKKLPPQPNKLQEPQNLSDIKGDYLKIVVSISRRIPPFSHMLDKLSKINPQFSAKEIININNYYDAYNNNNKNININDLKAYIQALSDFSNVILSKFKKVSNPNTMQGEKEFKYGGDVEKVADILNGLMNDINNIKPNETVADRLKTAYNKNDYDLLISALDDPDLNMSSNQIGGSQQYHKKYLKYKAKYMQLKNN